MGGEESTQHSTNNSHDSPVDKVVTFCGTKCFLLLHDCNLHKLIRNRWKTPSGETEQETKTKAKMATLIKSGDSDRDSAGLCHTF